MYNDEQSQNGQEYEQIQNEDEYDYNREPPLDHATASANRGRSKYVFMTLCFLFSAVLLYHYFTNAEANWFPLLAAIVLAIMGIVFLRSPDSPPTFEAATPLSDAAEHVPGKTLDPFEELVREALASIPDEFHASMENVMVHTVYEPDDETLQRVGVNEGHILLGLYEGVPLTIYGRDHAPYPEMITIYQRTIEDYCQHDPERIRAQVRSTVLHEIAHHFGMGHEEMPIWVK